MASRKKFRARPFVVCRPHTVSAVEPEPPVNAVTEEDGTTPITEEDGTTVITDE